MFSLLPQLVRKDSRIHLTIIAFLLLTLILLPIAVLGMTSASDSTDPIISGLSDPEFSKAFIPTTIGPGSVSTLRFDINNDSFSNPATELTFVDNLPAGVVIATPANVKNSCNGTLTAPDGGGTISLTGGSVSGSSSCIIEVDVTSTVLGTHTNVTGDLTSASGNSGTAVADLTVDPYRPGFSKSFAPSSVDWGGRSTLAFTIDNTSNEGSVVSLDFTDTLPVGMEIASPANKSTTCGTDPLVPTFTAVSGTDTISFSYFGSGSFPAVAASATCTVSVDVKATGVGLLVNSSGQLTSNSGQASVSSGKANAVLNVSVNSLYLTKSFINDPVAAGQTTTLEFTIRNQNRLSSATNIAFTDNLNTTLTGLVATGLPRSNVCGAGSQLTGTSTISLSGGSLGASGQCTFTVTLQVPAAAATGNYLNTTSKVTANVVGSPVEGTAGSDTLFVAPIPNFTKQFINDPVPAGGSATLRFNIGNGSSTAAATGIAFTDELTTILPTPIIAVLPATPCGAGSNISLVSLGVDGQGLSFTGGNLPASGSCTFDIVIDIPVGMPSGSFLNTTNNITAIVNGQPLEGSAATDTLEIVSAPKLRKSFIDDPVLPGETVILEFTIEHGAEEPGGATNIAFTDNLDAALSGLVATGLPKNNVCGAGSQISGTSTLSVTGGSLAPNETCTFTVTLQVPGGDILPGNYTNISSNVTATVLGLAVIGLPAQDDLILGGLDFNKSFIESPLFPGDTVTLRFMLENISATDEVTDIVFTDDLTAVLPNLVVIPPLPTEPCGTGSQISGSDILTFTGGRLAAGDSCAFDVTLQIPNTVQIGDQFENVTSEVTGMRGGLPITGGIAQDTLIIGVLPVYLPIVLNNALFAPDLVVTSVNVSGGNVQIEIVNQGTTPVTKAFWVDLYVNPTTTPTMVNQTWEIVGSLGAVWGVQGAALPLNVGETLTLTLNDAYYRSSLSNLPGSISGSTIYVQVDSAAVATTYGNVLETHEITNSSYNNILGPVSGASK